MPIGGDTLQKYGPWIFRAGVLVVFIILALAWNSSRAEKALLSKKVESLELEKKGLISEKEVKQRDLERAAHDLEMTDAGWRDKVKDLEKLLGEKPKVVRVVDVKTETKVVEVTKETPPRPCPTDDRKIILVEGDSLHAELKEVDYGTDAGNTVVTGRVSCWRDTPAVMLLHTELISAPGPTILVPVVEQPYRWGAGAFGVFTKSGWAVGPKMLFPPADLNLWFFKLRAETEVGLGVGGGGERVLVAGIGGRFR
jgi:hypothetical protein